MDKYLSLSGRYVTEKVIEKSRFIATSCHVESEEEAKAFIEEMRKTYRDATHNCYAYISDEKGNFMRFSDDGEPQGTAGMPMLEVLKANALKQTAVVVTRYFGGIKLGAGGLVRAYSGAVAENVAQAKMVCYQPCTQSEYIADYPATDTLLRYFSENDCSVVDTIYADKVRFIVSVKTENVQSFNSALVNKLNGRIEINPLGEFIFPFDI
ncbi:MAG: YigZ family protein [Candidatus Coproplasma sp.]